ncbi:hypothetical protein QUF72_07670 [Desulfobacterales bacterium HSG2]|nr:hypothetical protein [Desulfobacterales bacterium HSG2]
MEAPFLEYLLQKYAPHDNEPEKAKEKRVKKIISIREHICHLAVKKGAYYVPPVIKSYKCREIRETNEIGILKIKEGKNLVRIAFLTFGDKDKIVIFDAFDKPDLYQKAKKRKITKVEQEFIKRVERYIGDYLKSRHSLPLNI